uniref:Uncharacterized protein n=1 Tax=Anguilla anguilla TaxID=7936 RepID=A0A0E9X9F3_ANGAN
MNVLYLPSKDISWLVYVTLVVRKRVLLNSYFSYARIQYKNS